MKEPAANPLICALDTRDLDEACRLARTLSNHAGACKLGLEFIHAHGPEGIRRVAAAGPERLFLDVKLCDIPNTVAGAVRSLLRLRPWMLNIHALSGLAALKAAREAAREDGGGALLIGVTLLTSLGRQDVALVGGTQTPEQLAVRLAILCREAGLDGVVASALEAEAIRRECGDEFLIVVPGIRPAGAGRDDQVRVATPAEAIRRGADWLVVGRAITGAPDPAAAARSMLEQIREAA